mmetsp:Transcript_29536/g.48890  ORF Transcript_29536/g.48890 Transcript_29536/m.48890 type:complete len:213 (-) Transcript_29536:2669-3307(-)
MSSASSSGGASPSRAFTAFTRSYSTPRRSATVPAWSTPAASSTARVRPSTPRTRSRYMPRCSARGASGAPWARSVRTAASSRAPLSATSPVTRRATYFCSCAGGTCFSCATAHSRSHSSRWASTSSAAETCPMSISSSAFSLEIMLDSKVLATFSCMSAWPPATSRALSQASPCTAVSTASCTRSASRSTSAAAACRPTSRSRMATSRTVGT